MIEDGREAAPQLPGVEEERPVDVVPQHGQRRLYDLRAQEGRDLQAVEHGPRPVLAGRGEPEQPPPLLGLVLLPQLHLQLAVLAIGGVAAIRIEQPGHYAHHA